MTPDPSPARLLRRGRRVVVAVALLAVLAGCKTSSQDITGSIPDDYRAAHPIRIDEQLATMDIPVGADTAGLSTGMKGNIVGFAQRFKDSDSALMAIVVPAGSPNEVVATSVSHQIHDVLVRAGVSPRALDFRSYRAGAKETTAPIRLAFNRVAAHVEGCGTWPDYLEQEFRNRNYDNFGCATQSNLAAMVDNPLDLLYPRAQTPADALRRATVLEKYGKGEVYSAQQELESGEVAEGVGN